MTMLRKSLGPFAVGAVGVLLLVACSTKKDESLNPAMQASLQGLRDLPLTKQTLPDVSAIDAGAPSQGNGVETTTTFGDTEAGGDIVSALGNSITAGNGPGNGGVSTGNGPGNGGVGNGTGPGGGGVGNSTGAGTGGVSTGVSFGNASDLVSAVCDFLNALCTSISKCDTGKTGELCDSPVFRPNECVPLLANALAHTEKPVVVPPNAIPALRCVSNVFRNSGCLLSKDIEKGFVSKIEACGLPLNTSSSTSDDQQTTDTQNGTTTGTPTGQ